MKLFAVLGLGLLASIAPSIAVAGCEKDTDCKGDRICVEGHCESPEVGDGPAEPEPEPPPFNAPSIARVLMELPEWNRCLAGRSSANRTVEFVALPSGETSDAQLTAGPLKGTTEGDCLEQVIRDAKLPSFSGTAQGIRIIKRGKTMKIQSWVH